MFKFLWLDLGAQCSEHDLKRKSKVKNMPNVLADNIILEVWASLRKIILNTAIATQKCSKK